MIEFCTKKRMAIAIVILISVSIVTVVVESKWSTHHRINKEAGLKDTAQSENSSMCANGHELVVEACLECNKLELKSEKPYCQATGYKSRIRCSNGKQFFKSCPTNTWHEEKKFLLFECLTFMTGVFSFGVVRYRQRRLDHLLMEKINRQIASGL